MGTAPWPEHWMSPDAAKTACVVHIGSQPYHQVTAALDDEHTKRILGERGYRLFRIVGNPQKPAEDRHGVYRRRIAHEEPHGTSEAEA